MAVSKINNPFNELANYSKLLSVSSFVKDNVSVSAGSHADVTITITKSGYTPLGVVGINNGNATSSGVNTSHCAIIRFYNSASNVAVRIKNTGSSAAKIKITVYILYVKT